MAQGTGTGQPEGDRAGFFDRLRSGGNRSSFVYIVVGLVALTLTILLLIIYFSASERERTSPPICTDITRERAVRAVLAGEVDRLTIVYDETPYTPTSDRFGPVLAKIDYLDGSCSNLPQGVVNQEVVYAVAGVIAFYNENTEGQQVEVTYQKSDRLAEDLFQLPTEPPTATPTVEPTAIDTPAPSPTAEPPVTAPATPTPPGSPVASPIASPAPMEDGQP